MNIYIYVYIGWWAHNKTQPSEPILIIVDTVKVFG